MIEAQPVSVLLPSRGRPQALAESVESLRQTATAPERLEVLVAWDADDPVTEQVAQDLGARTLRFEDRPGYHRLHRYVNGLAELSTGEWLFLWNDDARMLTPQWDDVIRYYTSNQSIILSPLSTGARPMECCFPIFSWYLYELLGHCSLSPHIDTWLQDLGHATGILHSVSINILHDRYDLTGGHGDEVYAEGRAGYRTEEFYSPSMQTLLGEDIARVREWGHGSR